MFSIVKTQDGWMVIRDGVVIDGPYRGALEAECARKLYAADIPASFARLSEQEVLDRGLTDVSF